MTSQTMTAGAASGEEQALNLPMISVTLITCTTLMALDTSLMTIALPHIKGAVSATDDQITWVVTMYFVALALGTAVAGWLAGRFGRKRFFLFTLIGFTVTAIFAGTSTTLGELMAYRILQGLFAAPIVPLSQAMIMDSYPLEKHGQALSVWAMGVMVGPVFGPVIGGILTEELSWRWVFYVNVPVGIVAILGSWVFLRETEVDTQRRFDWFGFGALATSLVCFQLVLDRGERFGWFDSIEIIVEAGLSVLALYIFISHVATAKNPFVRLAIFKDKNFVIGLGFMFMNGFLVLSTTVVMPLFLITLRGFPVMTAGLAMGPRGFGTMVSMLVAGRLVGKVEPRAMIIFGILVVAGSSWWITTFNYDVPLASFMMVTMLHGLGFGFMWVPLVTMTFATLPAHLRTEANGVWSLFRNFGVSAGIAVTIAVLVHTGAKTHAGLTYGLSPYNEWFRGGLPGTWSLTTPQGLAQIEAEISRQSWMVGFINDFWMMTILLLLLIPFVLILNPAGARK